VRLGLTEDLTCTPKRSQALVKEWLSTEKNYLLIFDNAEEPEILKPYWPTFSGSVLTTSRNAVFVERKAVATGMELCTLSGDDGAQFLFRQLGEVRRDETHSPADQDVPPDGELDKAREISVKLGGHPLAMSHMACFIQESDNSLEDFLEIYNQHKSTILLHYTTGGAAFDYQFSYATCWALSFSKLRDQPASRLLGILALLDPDVIPEDLLRRHAYDPELIDIKPLADPATYGIAVALLRRHALVKSNKQLKELSIHRLVQDASIRYCQENGLLQIAFEDAMECLSRVYPRQQQGHSMFASYKECKKYTPQLLSIEVRYREMKARKTKIKAIELLAELLCHCGWYFYETADKQMALKVLHSARSISEEIHGSTPNKLLALIYSNIGVVYSSQEQGDEALKFSLLALDQRRQCLLPGDPQIGESCNNCASSLHMLERLEEAHVLFEESVVLQETNPNQNVNLLEGAYANLGRNFMALKNYEEAENTYQKAIALHDQCTGGLFFPALTLFLQGNLRNYQGRWQEAETLHRKALEMRLECLSTNHTLTGISLYQVARLLHRRGQDEGEDGSLRMLRDAHRIFETSPEAPGLVPRAKLKLASVLRKVGKDQDKDEMIQEAAKLEVQAKELIEAEPTFKGLRYGNDDDWDMLVEYEYR
jgi:tetratricopeptide (TPR) repeat protein